MLDKTGKWLKSRTALTFYPGLFLMLFYGYQVMNSGTEVKPLELGLGLLLLFLPFYLNLLLLIPYLLKQKHYGWYGLCFPVVILTSGYLPVLIGPDFLLSQQSIAINISNALILMVLSLGYQYALDYFREKRKQRQMERKQMETELQLLRMQLNPHFLFNTLNNLYGLAITKSDRLPDLMLKLSDLLRYLHDEAHKDAVALEKELDFLGNYIDLQKMRLAGNARVTYEQQGEPGDLTIPPAMLINFIENSFKHLNTEAREAFIDIRVTINDHNLDFKVVNSKGEAEPIKRDGTGLANIRKRLALLYPSQYELSVEDQGATFLVHLNLSLT